MKTKTFLAFVLVSLFIFSPFLNFESGAMSRTSSLQIKQFPEMLAVGRYCENICQWVGNSWCCTKFCCADNTGRGCYIADFYCIDWPDEPAN